MFFVFTFSRYFLLTLGKNVLLLRYEQERNIIMSIGDKIKYNRIRLGLTQTQLGERLGVKKNAVSKWECGRVDDIPTSKLKTMASLFGVPVSYLIDDLVEQESVPTKDENKNVVRIAGRDGSFIEKNLSDEQVAALKTLIDQLPEADDL